MAIPWSSIGLPNIPFGQNISVNLETLTGDGTRQLVERIPDTSPDKPNTWVLLNLIEPDPTGIGSPPVLSPGKKGDGTAYDLSGRKVTLRKGIVIQDGRKKAF